MCDESAYLDYINLSLFVMLMLFDEQSFVYVGILFITVFAKINGNIYRYFSVALLYF